MKALTFAFVCGVGAATLLVGVASCDDDLKPCNVDTDCPQGLICRESRCGAVTAEGGVSIPDSSPPTIVEDSAPPEPVFPACRQLYELCQNDCCVGYVCTAGTCR